MIDAILNHLATSTLFVAFVAVTVAIRRTDAARFRYYLWLLAALKFALPTAVFFGLGLWLSRLAPAFLIPLPLKLLGSRPVSRIVVTGPSIASSISWIPSALLLVWFFGTAALLWLWITSLRAQTQITREAPDHLADLVTELSRRIGLRQQVAVRSLSNGSDLAVFGVFRPVVFVPQGLWETLRPEELKAVLAHELMHVRRCDNLIALFVHVLTCIFWFHPALWWIESRMMVERELACDEAVIEFGWAPDNYAAGILKVCQAQVARLEAGSCGFCALSVKERIGRILSEKGVNRNHLQSRLTAMIFLALLGAAPTLFGFFNARLAAAQSTDGNSLREVACVFASVRYPEGAIVQEKGGHEQLCVVAFGRPMWVRTSREIRQQGQSTVLVPATPKLFCTPAASTAKPSCNCEEGGRYSSGSIVDSRHGRMTCSNGKWMAANGK